MNEWAERWELSPTVHCDGCGSPAPTSHVFGVIKDRSVPNGKEPFAWPAGWARRWSAREVRWLWACSFKCMKALNLKYWSHEKIDP